MSQNAPYRIEGPMLSAFDKAAALGDEHGERDTRAWWADFAHDYPTRDAAVYAFNTRSDLALPEPDHYEIQMELRLNGDESDAYCAAYREARDRVIAEAVQ